MSDVVIRNGKVVTHSDIFEADVAIEGEKIAAIGKGIGKGKREIDAGGKYVMPGCIDPHTHIGLFVDMDKDVKSETGAALAGGTTTILHCLFSKAPILETYKNVKASFDKMARCDFGFYAALLYEGDVKSIDELSEKGINSYKFLLAYKGKAAESIGLKDVNIDNGYLYRGMENIKKNGGVPMIHAENTELIFAIEDRFKNDNRLRTWADARPNIAEEIDLYVSCKIAEEVGSVLYQVHSSVGKAADIAREFRQRGNKVFLETCPHYFVTDFEGKNLKSPLLGKINPPIRSPKDREMVLAGLKKGEYDCIGTDTCNSMYKEKWADGNIWNMILDFSSIEYMLPLVLSELVSKGQISLTDAVRLTSYNSAKIHGLYPQKGLMAAGSDADIVVVDLDKTKNIKAKEMHSWSDYSLYEGWNIKGWPVLTMLRGKVVVENDKIVTEPGSGKYFSCKGAHK